MGTSWNKRHATTITGTNGDSIDRGEGQRRYWERYEEWKKGCMEGPPGRRKWKKMPLKWGDVWNPRLECWWSEIRIGHRYPEGHDQQGELTPKGELAAGIKKQEWKPNKTMPVSEKPSTLTAVTTTKWKRLSHREAIGEEE